jgi:hypothetical protein
MDSEVVNLAELIEALFWLYAASSNNQRLLNECREALVAKGLLLAKNVEKIHELVYTYTPMKEESHRKAQRDTVEEAIERLLDRLSVEQKEGLLERLQKELGRQTDLSEIHGPKRTEPRHLYADMRARAFGSSEPSVDSLCEYVVSLSSAQATSFEEKKVIVRTVNYWKRELNLELAYQGQACTLSVKKDRGQGGFQLRDKTQRRNSLYAEYRFPPITFRRLG